MTTDRQYSLAAYRLDLRYAALRSALAARRVRGRDAVRKAVARIRAAECEFAKRFVG